MNECGTFNPLSQPKLRNPKSPSPNPSWAFLTGCSHGVPEWRTPGGAICLPVAHSGTSGTKATTDPPLAASPVPFLQHPGTHLTPESLPNLSLSWPLFRKHLFPASSGCCGFLHGETRLEKAIFRRPASQAWLR